MKHTVDVFRFRIAANPPLRRLLLMAFLGVVFILIACDISPLERVVAGIDSTPTDCSSHRFEVNDPEDIYDGACNSHCTLREAIIAANACAGHDQIILQSETYTLQLRGPEDERGDLTITDDVDIFGEGPEATVVQGPGNWAYRVMNITEGSKSKYQV